MSAVVLADDPDGDDSDDDNADDDFYDVSDDEIHWAMEEDADPFDDPWDFDDD